MRTWHALAAAALALSALPAAAQEGNLRRFTDTPSDTNRSNRIIYVPLGWSFPEARPPRMGYNVASAAWHQVRLGEAGVRPDQTLDKSEYSLERFEEVANRPGIVRIVIERRPVEGGQPIATADAPPQLGLVERDTLISTQALPQVDRVGNGVRYTYTMPLPEVALLGQKATLPADTSRAYELRLKPAEEVQLPRYITRAPTFGGEDPQTRALMPPPTTTVNERVAGQRQETRGERDRKERKNRRDRK
ncbi:MAG: hypothetical protein ACK47B_08625 [Armatimonadota bacterium]